MAASFSAVQALRYGRVDFRVSDAMAVCNGFFAPTLVTGTMAYLVFGIVATLVALQFFVKEHPRCTKAESRGLALVVVWVSTICLWLFWAFTYMHQMVPLIYPVHTPK